jgi:hypothetical protein
VHRGGEFGTGHGFVRIGDEGGARVLFWNGCCFAGGLGSDGGIEW